MAKERIPDGLNLLHTLTGHRGVITRVAWSPDGRKIASPARDSAIRIWDAGTGKLLQTLDGQTGGHAVWYSSLAWSPDGSQIAATSGDRSIELWDLENGNMYWALDGHTGPVHSVSWSPDGAEVVTASGDSTVRLWDVDQTELKWTSTDHADSVLAIAWSPNGKLAASGSADRTIRIWEKRIGLALRQTFEGHNEAVVTVAWSPDGDLLASGSFDNTVRIWEAATGRQKVILEGHSDTIVSVSFAANGELLASKSKDGTVRLWRCDQWELVAVLDEQIFLDAHSSAVFHPETMTLASLGKANTVIRLWELDLPFLLGGLSAVDTVHYTNAKVILLGDTGVGKTGLGLVLTGAPFAATESTHGRHVWTMSQEKIQFKDGREETRETLLWDLAGQPGYRLIHQLHLNEIAVALVLFDSRSEADPFAGVRHWARALRQAQRIQGEAAIPMKKYLVAARVDRGGIGVSRERVEAVMDDLGFDDFFETSAKEGWDIPQLSQAIKEYMPWDILPKVSSTELFQLIKDFLINEKEKGRVLTTFDDLYNIFNELHGENIRFAGLEAGQDSEAMLRIQFETCIGRIESRDLIRRLSFGNLILLQPELLDAYASAIVNAAKSEPDGLGSIYEEDVRNARFRMATDERITNTAQEPLLLIATVEDLLRHEIALRESTDGGPILVFPSEFTREHGSTPDPEGKTAYFTFEGAILNIYATLVVRLLRSAVFVKDQMWRNMVTVKDAMGAKCGLELQELEEGHAKLTLFHTQDASKQTRHQFEEYVRLHLQRRAFPDTIFRHPIFKCGVCGFSVTDQLARLRSERGFDWAHCPVCTTRISLVDRPEKITSEDIEVLVEMDKAADEKRELALTDSIFQGKIATGDYDVMLCYHESDEPMVRKIADQLRQRGILPWPHSPNGSPAQVPIMQIKAVAFLIGKRGTGPGDPKRLMAFLRQAKAGKCIVVPALLPGGPPEVRQPTSLTNLPWIDFRQSVPNPINEFVNGVTEGRGRTSHRQSSLWVAGSAQPNMVPRVMDLGQLHQSIHTSFDAGQVRQLCADIGIKHQTLQSKSTSHLSLTRGLVAYCSQRGQIHNLVVACRQRQPDFPW
ncbi:MAG: hypothetical protein GY803_07525 [Chloroflexi bacterium]|nr:hypothetical protein [Chloroflexota bacterium]